MCLDAAELRILRSLHSSLLFHEFKHPQPSATRLLPLLPLHGMNSFAQDNAACLGQALSLLDSLSPETYTKVCSECLDSSIGAHLRHAIEHYQSFAEGYSTSAIDYDARRRDPSIETDPLHAGEVLRSLRNFLDSLASDDPGKELRVKMDCGSQPEEESQAWTASTAGRELQFLLSHAIHHYALISVICRTQKIPLAEGFGIAPSTLRHRKACAP